MTLPRVSSGAPSYRTPLWLRNAHAQTVWPLLLKGPLPPYRRQRWDTPDGDFIDLDWIDGLPDKPCVVLFHGLEGSSRSPYARRLMHAIRACGWHGVVMHFRGCSGEANRLLRAYHSGDATEIDWILRRLHAHGWPALFAVGVSLGGNALLKWLAETTAPSLLTAAAAVSAPLDLAAANAALAQGISRAYAQHFLRSLIPKTLEKAQRFPGLIDVLRVKGSRTLGEFDDAATAPLHGFLDAADYYARASAGPLLGAINTPTLLVHAVDDPFLPRSALPPAHTLPAAMTLQILPHGGHVGFVQGAWPGHIDWLPQRLLNYFDGHSR